MMFLYTIRRIYPRALVKSSTQVVHVIMVDTQEDLNGISSLQVWPVHEALDWPGRLGRRTEVSAAGTRQNLTYSHTVKIQAGTLHI
jgi:hypothetical protein